MFDVHGALDNHWDLKHTKIKVSHKTVNTNVIKIEHNIDFYTKIK